jgi:hypothetical protein
MKKKIKTKSIPLSGITLTSLYKLKQEMDLNNNFLRNDIFDELGNSCCLNENTCVTKDLSPHLNNVVTT